MHRILNAISVGILCEEKFDVKLNVRDIVRSFALVNENHHDHLMYIITMTQQPVGPTYSIYMNLNQMSQRNKSATNLLNLHSHIKLSDTAMEVLQQTCLFDEYDLCFISVQ